MRSSCRFLVVLAIMMMTLGWVNMAMANEPPVLDGFPPQTINVPKFATLGLEFTLHIRATDPDGTTPSLSVPPIFLPVNATFTDHGDGTGTFIFDPDPVQLGQTFYPRFIASDGVLADTGICKITVVEDVGLQDSVTIDVVNAERYDNDSVVVAVLVYFDQTNIVTGTIPVFWEPNDFWEYDTAYFVSERWTGPGKPDQLFINHSTLSTTDSSGLMISWQTLFNSPPPGQDTIVTIHFHRNLSQSSPAGFFKMRFLDWFPPNNELLFAGLMGGSWAPAAKFVDGVDYITIPAPPVWNPMAPKEVDEGANLNFGVLASDANDDPLILTAEDVPTNAIFVDNGDGTGTFDFDPDFGQAGLYHVRFIASDGSLADTAIAEIAVLEAGGILETIEDGVPTEYALGQNYPNPFNASTNIKFVLRQGGHARLEIFNILGQKIATLADEYLTAGPKLARWDGTDATGTPVGSGFYFYRLVAGEYVEMRKMILMK